MFLIYFLLLNYFCDAGNENYLYVNEYKKQSDAKSECETKGGELLSYLNETNIDEIYEETKDGNNYGLWVGLKFDDEKYQVII